MAEQCDAGVCGLLTVGDERVECSSPVETYGVSFDAYGARFTSFAGTAFNPYNPQHISGSDGLRLAIGIQMARDIKDYAKADRIRKKADAWGYCVQNAKDSTTVIYSREGRDVDIPMRLHAG